MKQTKEPSRKCPECGDYMDEEYLARNDFRVFPLIGKKRKVWETVFNKENAERIDYTCDTCGAAYEKLIKK